MSLLWLLFAIVSCSLIAYRLHLRNSEIKKRFPDIFLKEPSELEDFEVRRLKDFKDNQRTYGLVILIVLGVSIWMGAWQPHQVKVERESQRIAFIDSYAEGWNFYCAETFSSNLGSISTTGLLYNGSSSFSLSWCQGLFGSGDADRAYRQDGSGALSEYSDVVYSSRKGLSAGYQDSREAIFSVVPFLCFGTECISNDSETLRIENRAQQDWELEQENNFLP